MYQLTCPTCSCISQSSFVRSGAVVRCASCQSKYRIKSSQVERVLTTGPRTLDEAGSVLRSDSVDIDPEDIAPVKIDESGNVVGLSGLSELMRQSDARTAKAKLKARADQEPDQDDAPPMAIVPGRAGGDGPESLGQAQDRARSLSRKRKLRTNIMIVATLSCLFGISVIVLMMLVEVDGDDPATADAGQGPGQPSAAGNSPNTPAAPDLFPGHGSDTDPGGPGGPGPADVMAFAPPEPNPDPKYIPRHAAPPADALPVDVPTVLTPAVSIDHEGWYVMTPPRGDAVAAGDAEVEFGELTATPINNTLTRLTGTVTNRAELAVMSGEAHIALQDSRNQVFAETYLPVALIPPGGEQVVSLSIPTRFWERARGTRCSVSVTGWVDGLDPLDGVSLNASGRGAHTTLRLSVRYAGEGYLRDTLMRIEAVDPSDRLVGRYLVNAPDLYVASGDWLDLVVATPIDEDADWPIRWSATIQPK